MSDSTAYGAPRVHDDDGRPVPLVRRVRSDERAEVWCAADGRTAVSILQSPDYTAVERWRDRLAAIDVLDLTGLPFPARTGRVRSHRPAFAWRLPSAVMPLGQLAVPPTGAELLPWYAATGGLRGRLDRLGRVAAGIAAVHDAGLAYGDPSYAGILVPETGAVVPGRAGVWLTDVQDVTALTEVRRPPEVTSACAAPELHAGRLGVSSLSDSYAFAVLAFHVLATLHPFLGDEAYGDPALQHRAFAGELPWIDAAADNSNRSSYGLSRHLILDRVLRDLFARSFESGRHDPGMRPTARDWSAALGRCVRRTLACPRCTQTFFFGTSADCPWCGHHIGVPLLVGTRTEVPRGPDLTAYRTDVDEELIVPPAQITTVPAGMAGVHDGDPEQPAATLRWTATGGIAVHNRSSRPLWLISEDEALAWPVEPATEVTVPVVAGRPCRIHFGPPGTTHRLLEFGVPG